jgi:hypothetical protein
MKAEAAAAAALCSDSCSVEGGQRGAAHQTAGGGQTRGHRHIAVHQQLQAGERPLRCPRCKRSAAAALVQPRVRRLGSLRSRRLALPDALESAPHIPAPRGRVGLRGVARAVVEADLAGSGLLALRRRRRRSGAEVEHGLQRLERRQHARGAVRGSSSCRLHTARMSGWRENDESTPEENAASRGDRSSQLSRQVRSRPALHALQMHERPQPSAVASSAVTVGDMMLLHRAQCMTENIICMRRVQMRRGSIARDGSAVQQKSKQRSTRSTAALDITHSSHTQRVKCNHAPHSCMCRKRQGGTHRCA